METVRWRTQADVYVSRVEYEYWRGAGEPVNASDIDAEYLAFLTEAANEVFDDVCLCVTRYLDTYRDCMHVLHNSMWDARAILLAVGRGPAVPRRSST